MSSDSLLSRHLGKLSLSPHLENNAYQRQCCEDSPCKEGKGCAEPLKRAEQIRQEGNARDFSPRCHGLPACSMPRTFVLLRFAGRIYRQLSARTLCKKRLSPSIPHPFAMFLSKMFYDLAFMVLLIAPEACSQVAIKHGRPP